MKKVLPKAGPGGLIKALIKGATTGAKAGVKAYRATKGSVATVDEALTKAVSKRGYVTKEDALKNIKKKIRSKDVSLKDIKSQKEVTKATVEKTFKNRPSTKRFPKGAAVAGTLVSTGAGALALADADAKKKANKRKAAENEEKVRKNTEKVKANKLKYKSLGKQSFAKGGIIKKK